jgi:acid phosphatase (class A)
MKDKRAMTTNTVTRYTLLCGLTAASLFGQAAAPAKAPKTPVFIAPEMVQAVVLISPPPAIDSKKMSKDLAEIYALHRSSSPQEIEKANWDNQHEDIFAIGMVLGDKFTKESLPATTALWADMNNDQGIVVSAAKKFFQHPRPYDLDSNIKSICGSKPGGPKNSYPSGHGTVGYLSALVLTMMVPEKAELIRTRADEYAHNRVICGDHYASDLPASKEAADLIMGNMLGNARFQQEFAAAKAEVRKAIGL